MIIEQLIIWFIGKAAMVMSSDYSKQTTKIAERVFYLMYNCNIYDLF